MLLCHLLAFGSLAELLHLLGTGKLLSLGFPLFPDDLELLVELVGEVDIDIAFDSESWVDFAYKLVPHHFQQLVNHSQLQDLFVNCRKYQLQVVLDLPLQYKVLVVVLVLSSLLFEQDIFHEDIKQVKLEITEGLVPQDYTSGCKNTHEIEHFLISIN